MIRLIRAFAWLRWRLLVNTVRPRRSRDVLERASRIGAALVPVALAALLLPLALLAGAGGLAAGWFLGHAGEAERTLQNAARALLGIVTLAVLFGPLVRSMSGGTANLARLVLLPVPRRVLFLSEVVSSIADPWIFCIAPGIALVPVGLAASGAYAAAAAAATGGALFLGALLLLGALCAFAVQLVFRSRRRAELLTLVVAAALSLAGFIPAVAHGAFERGGASADRGTPAWLLAALSVLPSDLYVQCVASGAQEGFAGAAVPLAGLAVAASILCGFSWAIYRRLLESPATASGRRGGGRAPTILTVPLLSPAAAAVGWAQVRAVLRTVIGRIGVLLGPVVYALLVFLLPRAFPETQIDRFPLGPGALFVAGAMVFAVVSMHRVLLNQFAIDGAGLTLQLISPVSDVDLVAGKFAGGALMFAISLGLYLSAALLLGGPVDPFLLATLLLGGIAAFVLFAPTAAILAAMFPKPGDLSRIGSASNPHPVAAVLGLAVTAMSFAPVSAIVSMVALGNLREPLACSIAAAWLASTAVAAVPITRLAAAVVGRRRENLALVALGR